MDACACAFADLDAVANHRARAGCLERDAKQRDVDDGAGDRGVLAVDGDHLARCGAALGDAFFAEAQPVLVDQPGQNMTKMKRENIFITIIESLPGAEADMLVAAKDKKLHKLYKGITADVAKLAFPEILPDNVK